MRRVRDGSVLPSRLSRADLLRDLKAGGLDIEDEVLHPGRQQWVPLWRVSGIPRPMGWDLLVGSCRDEMASRVDAVRSGKESFDSYLQWRRRRLAALSTEGMPTQVGGASRIQDRVPGSRLVPEHVRRDLVFVRELGQGGFGSVSLWQNQKAGTQVAIKVTEPGFGDAVQNEVRLLEELRSFHVVRVRHYGEIEGSGGRWFVVFDFIPGDTLAQFMAGDIRPDAETIQTILVGIARGLADLHASKIVHRDLKPANVILRQTGESGELTPVLIDLGMARSGAVTGTKMLGGTPGYQSPEQERGEVCGPASDVFCFGLIAYELVTRRRVVGAQLIRLHDACPGLPAQLDSLVKERCLVDDSSKRLPDGMALREELQRVFASVPAGRAPVPASDGPVPGSAAVIAAEPAVMPWKRRQQASDARAKADAGDPVAMYRLGMMYLEGKGVTQDKREAVALLRRAATSGVPDAMLQLARELATVQGVEDDSRSAVDWFKRAAAAGNNSAMFEVSELYRAGFRQVVERDARERLDWIERASMAGHARAMWHLGRALRRSKLRKEDRGQSVAWFREGAERRDAPCMLYLAWCLFWGDGCIRDRVEARRWIRRWSWLLLSRWTLGVALWLVASAFGLALLALAGTALAWKYSGWRPFGVGFPGWP